jgi:hypothetical protein
LSGIVRNEQTGLRDVGNGQLLPNCVGASAVGAKLIYFFVTEGSNERLNARENISSCFH